MPGWATRGADGLAWALLGAVFLNGLFIMLSSPASVWVDILADDVYYYLGIARNMAEHGVSSFLPPFRTNGYQPLWLALLSVSAALFGASDTGLVVQVYCLTFLFVFIFAFISRAKYGLAFPAILAVMCASYMIAGMESVMIPVFFILFITASGWKTRGLFATLLFFSRLDTLAVIVARDIYFYLRKRETDFRHYRILGPALLAYALSEYLLFGLPVPVSGLAKAVGSRLGENFFSGGYIFLKGLLMPGLIVYALLLLIVYINKSAAVRPAFFDEINIAIMACVGCAFYYGALSGWPIWSWYFWAAFLVDYYLLLSIMRLLAQCLPMANGARKYASLGLLLLALAYMGKPALAFIGSKYGEARQALPGAKLEDSYGRKNLELVAWIRKNHIPPQSFFAMGDRAGSFGFFLGNDYRFLHTEGLVGPSAYYRALAADRALDFVDAQPIDFWVADREEFIESGGLIGLIEPAQGMSMHKGPYVVCFRKEGVILDQSYNIINKHAKPALEKRYVFAAPYRTACPLEIIEQFERLKQRYGGVLNFSLPFETTPGSLTEKMVEFCRERGWISR